MRRPDLAAALADEQALSAESWRIHYHVPLYTDRLDHAGRLRTTRGELELLIAALDGASDAGHLEIETYSFFMIPPALRVAWGADTLLDCLEQEIGWVLKQL